MTFLPNLEDAPEGAVQTKSVVSHFDTIKTFYGVVQKCGFDSTPEMDLFFNSLQIYEVNFFKDTIFKSENQ